MDEVRLEPADWPAALADTDGRQIVVAGPGTGKTEFLVRRVKQIVDDGRANQAQIVVLSFSRRGASRLRDRIEDALGATGVPVDVSTFHSLALRLIEAASGGSRPLPLTTPEQIELVRVILSTEDIQDWPVPYREVLDSRAFSTEVADFLLRCSERLLTPSDLAERAVKRADWRGLPALYQRYLKRLSDLGRTDYGVLLNRAVELLRTEEGRRQIENVRYVLVDEYQDTTPAQAAMADLLASGPGNLTVAGDPYQSIFSFRGAELRNVSAFCDTPGTRRIVLARSFRVPNQIMEAALRVVSGGDLPGSAGPVEPAPHTGSCEAYVFDQETAETEWIAREAEHLVRVEGVDPSRIAVVVRSKRDFISELSRALERRSLPHDPPDSRLVDHPAVRVIHDVVIASTSGGSPGGVSPLEAAVADAAMSRLLLGPLFGIPVGQLRDMLRDRRRRDLSWADTVGRHLPARRGFVGLLADSDWATDLSAAHGFWATWSRLDGIAAIVEDPRRAEWRRAWAALAQMLSRQAERDPNVTLARFFEMVDDEDFEATPLISHRLAANRIALTTLHQVKGLEFDVVFIANAVEGVFPDLRRSRRILRPELLSPERMVDPDAQHLFQVQEEMRLGYTAMTRARHRVVWTATEAGIDQGEKRPSRFLIAAAGDRAIGPPTVEDRDPLTVTEAETALRRELTDVGAGKPSRLAAARVLGSPPGSWWDSAYFPGAVEPGPDTPVLTAGFRLSPSQADSYRRCPRRYVLERRLQLGDSSSVYAHFGELTHEILERAEREIIGTHRRHADLGRVLEIVDDVWADKAEFGSADLNRAWKAKADEMLTKLYERWPGKGEPIEVELYVESEIEGVRWMGRIDRLESTEEGMRVVDYKTSASPPRIDDAAESIQLGFYALAIQKSHGRVVASEMWLPRARGVKVTTRKLAMHLLSQVEETMVNITRSIVSEDWTPKVSDDCRRCGFRRSCPAWPEGKGAFLP